VQLNLPVRLRWLAPLGQLTEVTETLDVSRGGLLVNRPEPCGVSAALWVTFPFDPTLELVQPETPACVVRVKDTPAGGHWVGIAFNLPERHAAPACAGDVDRRRRERVRLALPIRVWLAGSPWPEETMTVDVSEDGVLFCTARMYSVGDAVRVGLPPGILRRQPAQVPARVVRVARRAGSVEQEVAIVLLPPERPSS
jgi:hypothetical protein